MGPKTEKLPVELPILNPDLIKKSHLKQDQETSDDHTGFIANESSPYEETGSRKQETPKKPIPVVLPVLPLLTQKPHSDPILTNKTVREKPREPRCPSPSNHYQKEIVKSEQSTTTHTATPVSIQQPHHHGVQQQPTHPQFSSKIDKYR